MKKPFDKFGIGFLLFTVLINGAFIGIIWYAFSHNLKQSAILGAIVAAVGAIYFTYKK